MLKSKLDRYHRYLQMRFIVTFLAISFSISGFAAPSSPMPQPAKGKVKTDYLECPPINQLHLNPETKIWSATGGWKTFSVSFAIKSTHFLGAQWEGVNQGNIFCLYNGIALGNKQTFSINLQHPGLVDEPSGGKWTKNLGGYRNCMSSEQAQCKFVAFKQKKPANMYQTLDNLKSMSPGQLGY